jgi:hypothetical protein
MSMKFCSSAVFSTLIILSLGKAAQAQTAGPVKPKKPASASVPTGKAKESLEAQFARQNFKQVLDAVNDSWFGKPYAGVNAVDLQGSMVINLTANAMNAKVDQLGQGAVKGGLSQGATVNVKLKGTYFANADFRTELNGEFGNLLYYRVGNRGFLYSKEQNAWTSRVDPAPAVHQRDPDRLCGWFHVQGLPGQGVRRRRVPDPHLRHPHRSLRSQEAGAEHGREPGVLEARQA